LFGRFCVAAAAIAIGERGIYMTGGSEKKVGKGGFQLVGTGELAGTASDGTAVGA
jgi:hypothetical protein